MASRETLRRMDGVLPSVEARWLTGEENLPTLAYAVTALLTEGEEVRCLVLTPRGMEAGLLLKRECPGFHVQRLEDGLTPERPLNLKLLFLEPETVERCEAAAAKRKQYLQDIADFRASVTIRQTGGHQTNWEVGRR